MDKVKNDKEVTKLKTPKELNKLFNDKKIIVDKTKMSNAIDEVDSHISKNKQVFDRLEDNMLINKNEEKFDKFAENKYKNKKFRTDESEISKTKENFGKFYESKIKDKKYPSENLINLKKINKVISSNDDDVDDVDEDSMTEALHNTKKFLDDDFSKDKIKLNTSKLFNYATKKRSNRRISKSIQAKKGVNKFYSTHVRTGFEDDVLKTAFRNTKNKFEDNVEPFNKMDSKDKGEFKKYFNGWDDFKQNNDSYSVKEYLWAEVPTEKIAETLFEEISTLLSDKKQEIKDFIAIADNLRSNLIDSVFAEGFDFSEILTDIDLSTFLRKDVIKKVFEEKKHLSAMNLAKFDELYKYYSDDKKVIEFMASIDNLLLIWRNNGTWKAFTKIINSDSGSIPLFTVTIKKEMEKIEKKHFVNLKEITKISQMPISMILSDESDYRSVLEVKLLNLTNKYLHGKNNSLVKRESNKGDIVKISTNKFADLPDLLNIASEADFIIEDEAPEYLMDYKSEIVDETGKPVFEFKKQTVAVGTDSEDNNYYNDSVIVQKRFSLAKGFCKLWSYTSLIKKTDFQKMRLFLKDASKSLKFDDNVTVINFFNRQDLDSLSTIRITAYAANGVNLNDFEWDVAQLGNKPFLVHEQTQDVKVDLTNFVTGQMNNTASTTNIKITFVITLDTENLRNENDGIPGIEHYTGEVNQETFTELNGLIKDSGIIPADWSVNTGDSLGEVTSNNNNNFYSVNNYYAAKMIETTKYQQIKFVKNSQVMSSKFMLDIQNQLNSSKTAMYSVEKMKVDEMFNSNNSAVTNEVLAFMNLVFPKSPAWSNDELKSLYKDLNWGSKPMTVKELCDSFMNKFLGEKSFSELYNATSSDFIRSGVKDTETFNHLFDNFKSKYKNITPDVILYANSPDLVEINKPSKDGKTIKLTSMVSEDALNPSEANQQAYIPLSIDVKGPEYIFNFVKNVVFMHGETNQMKSSQRLLSISERNYSINIYFGYVVFRIFSNARKFDTSEFTGRIDWQSINAKFQKIIQAYQSNKSAAIHHVYVVALIMKACAAFVSLAFKDMLSTPLNTTVTGSNANNTVNKAIINMFSKDNSEDKYFNDQSLVWFSLPTTEVNFTPDKSVEGVFTLTSYEQNKSRVADYGQGKNSSSFKSYESKDKKNFNKSSTFKGRQSFFDAYGNNSETAFGNQHWLINKSLWQDVNIRLDFKVIERTEPRASLTLSFISNVNEVNTLVLGLGQRKTLSRFIPFNSYQYKSSKVMDGTFFLLGKVEYLLLKPNAIEWLIALGSSYDGYSDTGKHYLSMGQSKKDSSTQDITLILEDTSVVDIIEETDVLSADDVIKVKKIFRQKSVDMVYYDSVSLGSTYEITTDIYSDFYAFFNYNSLTDIFNKLIVNFYMSSNQSSEILQGKPVYGTAITMDPNTWTNYFRANSGFERQNLGKEKGWVLTVGDSIKITTII